MPEGSWSLRFRGDGVLCSSGGGGVSVPRARGEDSGPPCGHPHRTTSRQCEETVEKAAEALPEENVSLKE